MLVKTNTVFITDSKWKSWPHKLISGVLPMCIN